MIRLPLFNITDLVVLITAFIGFLLALLSVLGQSQRFLANRVFALFMLSLSLFSIDTVIYWNERVQSTLLEISPNFFFFLSFALLMQGPLVYTYSKLKFKGPDTQLNLHWHLLPGFCYPIIWYYLYASQPESIKLGYLQNWQLVLNNPYFMGLIWVQRLSVLLYAGLCLKLTLSSKSKSQYVLSHKERTWQRLIIWGFFGLSLWIVLALVLSRFLSLDWAGPMGVIANYARLTWLCVLLGYLLKNNALNELVADQPQSIKPLIDQPPSNYQSNHNTDADELQWLLNKVETDKPYLDPYLTQEKLARHLGLSPRVLSQILNQQRQQNFAEFVSHYRLEMAKSLLVDSQQANLSIAQVMEASGFNSKSAFNRLFKQATGLAPSDYRRKHRRA